MNDTSTYKEEEAQTFPSPFNSEEPEPPSRPEGFNLVRGFEMPMVTRRSTYPFADMKVHDAIIFDTSRELKNALQAARTFQKHSPKFKVSGRKISRGEHAGKFAIIRVA